MVVGAAVLAVLLIATLVYLGTGSIPSSGVSHVKPKASPIAPGYAVLGLNSTTVDVVMATVSPPRLYETVDLGLTWRRLTDPIPLSEQLATWNLLADGKLILETWDRSDPRSTHAYVGDVTGWTEVIPPVSGGGWPHMLDSRVGFYLVSGEFASVTGPASGHFLRIYRTLDSGSHWDLMLLLDDAHPTAGGLTLAEQHVVAFTDATHGWLISTSQPYATVCGPTGWTPAGRLLASDDGGQHWSERRLAPLPDGSAQLAPPVLIRQSGAGYMVASLEPYIGKCPPDQVGYAYATIDGGESWSPPRRLPTEFFSSLDGIDWWATDGKRVLRSHDQGVSWTTKVARLPARDMKLGVLYPAGGDTAWSFWEPGADETGRIALLHTTDGGATWTEVKLPPT